MVITAVCGTAIMGSIPVGRPKNYSYASIAQLDRAPVFGTGGRGFESLWTYHVKRVRTGKGSGNGSLPCRKILKTVGF